MKRYWRAIRESLLIVALLFGLVAGAVVIGARTFGWFQWVELYAYDLLVQMRVDQVAPSGKVVLIGAREEDLLAYGWPLSDNVLHDALKQILSGGPRAVGVDIYRDRPIAPGSEALAALLSAHPEIIWIEKFAAAGRAGIPAPEALHGTDQIGFADIVIDDDGVVRRGLLYLSEGERISQAFALAMAMRYLAAENIFPQPSAQDDRFMALGAADFIPLDPDFGGYTNADVGGYQYMLTFTQPTRSASIIPFGSVLDGNVESERFADAVVIIGTTSDSVKDYFLTPFDRGRNLEAGTYGVAVHGLMTDQLIRLGLGQDRALLSAPSQVAEMIYIILSAIVGALLTWFTRQWLPAGGFIVATFAAHVGIAIAAFYLDLWVPVVPAIVASGFAFSATLIHFAGIERRQRRALDSLFSRMVAPAVAEELWDHRDEFLDGGRPAPREQEATVLFSDIVGFTSISETMSAKDLMRWLNLYIARMADIVAEHQGVVDKFIGDAVMAVFGIPVARQDADAVAGDAKNAVACAQAMKAALPELNAMFANQNLPEVQIRVGIHTGALVVGGLGSAGRMQYTVIGDTVNVASRLEGFPKSAPEGTITPSDCVIVVSAVTAAHLGTSYDLAEVGQAELKGKSQPLLVYQVR